MCGIAAIFNYGSTGSELDRDELRRIRDSMSKRGPDGSGEWFSQDQRVGLGHRRLSVIDLSEKAAQPMKSQDGNLVITFNGEIYNYRQLRHELKSKGFVFQSQSDTEVLLHLYAEKGEGMVKDLRGMFAFALWDGKKKAMFLARDPYGIKPLYYTDDGCSVRIASQVKALLAGGKVSRRLDPAGVVGFFLFGSVPEPYTLYQEIRELPAGSTLRIDGGGPSEPQPYFSMAQIFREAAQKDFDEEPQNLARQALLDSVSHHFVSDVPVGIFLSSGIDSGSLVGMARDTGVQELQAITLGFREFQNKQNDEIPLAEKVASFYGMDHRTRILEESEFKRELGRVIEAMDQPTIDGINTYFVSKAASERGLKVALSGLGGDELFGGYPSFQEIPRSVRILGLPSKISFFGDFFQSLYSTVNSFSSIGSPKVSGVFKYGGSYPGAYFLRRGLFMPWELGSLLDQEILHEGLQRLEPIEYIRQFLSPDPQTPFGRVATLEASVYMRNQLLRDADWAGMTHSIEIRTPFVDSYLLKKVARILISGSVSNQKHLLAESPSAKLPDPIARRPKSGFSVPINTWLQTNKEFDSWRGVGTLAKNGCPWARRWAYVIAQRQIGEGLFTKN